MAGREFLKRQAQAAAALGHLLEVEVRDRRDEFPDEGQHAIKHWTVCSCGWRSRPAARAAVALASGFHHLGQVAGANSPARTADSPKLANVPRSVGGSL